LSEAQKISLSEAKGWLERETRSIFVPVHTRAQRLRDEMSKALGNLSDNSKVLLENSGKEIEKRNMKIYGRARALNKLARVFIDRMRQMKAPDQVSYESLSDFTQEVQKAFVATEVDVRNYFPRISPFFILDRRRFLAVFERAKDSLKELNTFVTREYVRTKTLEETFELIDKLQSLGQQVSTLEGREKEVESELASIGKEIADTQQRIADLKIKGSLGQLGHVEAEIDTLSVELKQSLQQLQKPFIKLQSLAIRGGGSGLMQDESKKLNDYLENLFEAFATEQAGLPLLKAILEKLDKSMPEKLSLKPEKERKARQAIDNIINKNSLVNLHQRCVDAMVQKKRLSTSAEIAERQADLSKLHEQLGTLERRRKILESEKTVAERTRSETLEKIRTAKATIEKNVFDFTSKKIHIE
jgi:hypothetical protein